MKDFLKHDKVETNQTLEERNVECADEMKALGTLRNARFVSKDEFPKISCMSCTVTADSITFHGLPEQCSEVCIYAKDEDYIDLYTEKPAVCELVYSEYDQIVLKNISSDIEYRLNTEKEKRIASILRTHGTELMFYNDALDLSHYNLVCGSGINVLLLKDGWIRIVTKNMKFGSLLFRNSETFEQTIDVVVDDSARPGDYVIQNMNEISTEIYAPVLSAALMRQAIPLVFDMNRGLFYFFIRFTLSENVSVAGNVFVDFNRYKSVSNIGLAQKFFENDN